MYTQDFDPVSDSLGLTSIFAVLPLVTLFVLLGGVKMKAQWAALISLAVAMIVALAVYGMPFGQTALSATEGAAFVGRASTGICAGLVRRRKSIVAMESGASVTSGSAAGPPCVRSARRTRNS